jgi:hypothetical protein
MGRMNLKRPTAIKGTMNHAKTSFSTEICAGAINSVVQYLAPLRYSGAFRCCALQCVLHHMQGTSQCGL